MYKDILLFPFPFGSMYALSRSSYSVTVGSRKRPSTPEADHSAAARPRRRYTGTPSGEPTSQPTEPTAQPPSPAG